MPLSVSISGGFNAVSIAAGQAVNFVAAVTNATASALTLQSLAVTVASGSRGGASAGVTQPSYLWPNVPVGVGNPVLPAGVTQNYSFSAVFFAPNASGPSPQNQPGGAAPSNQAQEIDPFYVLTATGLDSSAAVFTSSFFVPVLSTIAPFPLAQGGALQLSQGMNLVNLTMLGAL